MCLESISEFSYYDFILNLGIDRRNPELHNSTGHYSNSIMDYDVFYMYLVMYDHVCFSCECLMCVTVIT